nr:MAG TPA: hypothetical protein [Caudoviricetes sp.]
MDQLGRRPGRRPRTNGPTVGAKRRSLTRARMRVESISLRRFYLRG